MLKLPGEKVDVKTDPESLDVASLKANKVAVIFRLEAKAIRNPMRFKLNLRNIFPIVRIQGWTRILIRNRCE